jgi:translocation and assembly module TamB
MRRILRISLGLLLAGALALAALPWWLGPTLAPLGRGQGVTFARYERVGYGRFRLLEVRREDRGTRFAAGVVEGDTPLLWAWRSLWRGDTRVSVADWTVESTGAAATPADRPDPTGVAELQANVSSTLATLARWLPLAVLQHGEVRIAGLPAVTVAAIDWKRGGFSARGVRIADHEFELSVWHGAGNALELRVDAAADAAQVALTWTGAAIEGSGTWQAQPLRLRVHFPDHGWIPADAELVAENWSLPAARIRLGDQYAELTGGGRLVWRETQFELTGECRAEPKAGAKAPPMRARLAAHGDRSAITIATLDAGAPFAEAKLSAPVMIGFGGPFKAPPAQLTLRADLAKQAWFEAVGVVEGSAGIREAGGGSSFAFQLACDGLRVAGFELRRAAVQGELNWPRLELRNIALSLDDRSQLAGHGVIDLQRREFGETSVRGSVTPAWFQRWLPAGASWTTAEFIAALSGPLAAPRHRGSATFGQLSVAPLRPLELSVDWQGRGAEVDEFKATATAGESLVRATGAVSARRAQLNELHWQRSGAEVLTLAAPTRFEWAAGWRIAALRLAGPNGGVELSGTGGDGELAFKADAMTFDSAWLRDWIVLTGPAWTLQTLHAEGHTENKVLHFVAEVAGQVSAGPASAQIAMSAKGDAAGVTIDRCEVRDAAGIVARAQGRLPVSWSVSQAPRLQVDRDGALQFRLETQPDSPLWSALVAPLGFAVEEPRARLRLGGTPAAPTGELELSARHLAMTGEPRATSLPTLDDINVRAHADRGAVVLEALTATIEGQTLQARARCPLDAAGWRQLVRAPVDFDWSAAEGELEIPAADLHALAARWDQSPFTQGRLQIAAKLARGFDLSGSLKLTGGTSRPIPSVGVLQQVTAELELKGRSVVVRTLSALLGGESVMVSGSADLAELSAPKLDLKLFARNLPLVRRAGLLIRSDIDLTVVTDAGATRVAGTANLHDSLVLADLRQFLPTGLRAAGRAPPYFAVTAEPFRDWRLDVAISGTRGVRLHTPVLAGFASPRFQLEGTLGDPRSVGEVVLEDGRIIFPFATFKTQLAAVRLSKADPFHPELRLNAAVRRYGYDLRLEGRGPVDQPILTFSSVPALTSEQVLLLVMAGQMPGDTAVSGIGDRKRLTVLGAYLGRGFFGGLGGDDSERLTITSGEQVTQQGGETYLVEYLLGNRWSLVGEYDEFDDYNVGLKWRVFSEGGNDDGK